MAQIVVRGEFTKRYCRSAIIFQRESRLFSSDREGKIQDRHDVCIHQHRPVQTFYRIIYTVYQLDPRRKAVRDVKIWRHELIDIIRIISDESETRKLWSGENNRKFSFYAEDISLIFDTYDINGFLLTGLEITKLTEIQHRYLEKFRDCLNMTVDKFPEFKKDNYNDVLNHPQWKILSSSARKFIEILD